MNQDVIKAILTNLLSTFFRNGLLLVGAWMARHNIHWLNDSAQTDLVNAAVGSLLFGGALAWSYLRSHFMKKEIVALGGTVIGAPSVPPSVIKMLLLIPCLYFTSCAIISSFDQNSLDTAKKLKYSSITLIAHGNEDPAAYQEEIKALQDDLSAELAYEKGKGAKNLASEKQWEILSSPEHLLGRFLREWSAGKKLSRTYIDEDSKLIADTFDSIIELEGAKSH